MQKIKRWLNENPKHALAGAAGVCAVAILFLLVRSGGTPAYQPPAQFWFYDLNRTELFAADRTPLPPIAAPSGALPDGRPAGVQARVFTCNGCGASDQFIGWLEMYTPEGKERASGFAHEAPPDQLGQMVLNDKLIAAAPAEGAGPDAIDWHGWDTPEAERIRAAVHGRCDGGEARECLP